MAPFKRYEQLSELVKMYPCLYNKQEKDFKKEEVKQRAWKEIAKELDQIINVEPKLTMPEAVNDVCMPSLCFHERIFSSKFGDNISLVGMSWRYRYADRYKNIALKILLSPGNKSGDSFNFYLQKKYRPVGTKLKKSFITVFEPSFSVETSAFYTAK